MRFRIRQGAKRGERIHGLNRVRAKFKRKTKSFIIFANVIHRHEKPRQVCYHLTGVGSDNYRTISQRRRSVPTVAVDQAGNLATARMITDKRDLFI
jgi:hypothetical protein